VADHVCRLLWPAELHDATVRARYRGRFADDPDAASLANWDVFEREHPDTFAESSKFWLKKPGGSIE